MIHFRHELVVLEAASKIGLVVVELGGAELSVLLNCLLHQHHRLLCGTGSRWNGLFRKEMLRGKLNLLLRNLEFLWLHQVFLYQTFPAGMVQFAMFFEFCRYLLSKALPSFVHGLNLAGQVLHLLGQLAKTIQVTMGECLLSCLFFAHSQLLL